MATSKSTHMVCAASMKCLSTNPFERELKKLSADLSTRELGRLKRSLQEGSAEMGIASLALITFLADRESLLPGSLFSALKSCSGKV